MRKIYFLPLLVLVCITLFSCCKDKGCSSTPDSIVSKVRRVNIFDNRIGSPYQGQCVAIFEFTQDNMHYQPANSCSFCVPNLKSQVRLKIKNLIQDKRLKFDYNVTFTLNYATWNNQNVVSIEPGATIDEGIITTNLADITMGSIVILSMSGATYIPIIYENA